MQMKFPARSGPIDPTAVPWVAELDPAPVMQYSLPPTGRPGPGRKFPIFLAMTNGQASRANAEPFCTRMLPENVGLGLVAGRFSTPGGAGGGPRGHRGRCAAVDTRPKRR